MVWTAFILGFAGSLHCLGMCSPLAMSVANTSSTVMMNRMLYNAGRIVTYGVVGGAVASVGLALPLFKYQNIISIFLGVSLLVSGITGISGIRIPIISSFLSSVSAVLKNQFRNFLQLKSHGSIFLMGALNGLLPCGLSFLAFTYCLTLSGPFDGFFFMMLFGVGTLPVMLGLTSIFLVMVKRFQLNMKKVTTGMLIVSGMLLIARVFIVHLPHKESIQQGVVDIVLCR
jgi:sulfite exporter TauE/SafE